jgi:predicted GIY-YIG superfamily endonuclease
LAKPGRCRGACSTLQAPDPGIARNPCDEAIQGLLHLALCGLPRTRFRTILSAFGNRRPEIPVPRAPCVYNMASDRKGTLYTDARRPGAAHPPTPPGLGESFTRRYRCKQLVFYETYERMDDAIARETQIKGGSRAKKMARIETMNPQWRDLYADFA